ncbi:glycosyl hydrolase family 30 [Bifidobacterium margollesii]|uniref:Glycosyl hydrolase family 30 n=1 Tax=Bifidobacterium margollesii TaxID=2020964 RepID=A0A2N5JCQ1_9BIFI|nr:glycosyl hydrolase family 30 [Bifidobacterium margollesii]PLS31993.1 glycosyl hydrolase family 30 [Bifidobacterium margollesii]
MTQHSASSFNGMGFANEFWTSTSGDLAQRRETLKAPEYVTEVGDATPIVVDPADRRQPWVGAGAAITDAAASLIWGSMDAEQRHAFLDDAFNPAKGGFSVIRIPLGSCEPSAQPYYTYDDLPFGEHDNTLSRFSLGEGEPGAPDATKDFKYIIPVVLEILKINPAVKIIASPWSAPAWMKNTGHLCQGGHLRFDEWTGNGFDPMHDSFEGCYARYFVKYVEEMAKVGIPIWGVTVQNEPSNAPKWPAMMWTLKQQAEFAHKFLRPAMNEKFPEMRIFINDDSTHNILWPVNEVVTPQEAASVDGFTVHTYEGPYSNFFNASRSFPHWMFGMTERRCMIDETPEDAAHIMLGIIGNWLVRNGESFIALWNLALDERGLPNQVGATGRRGVVTIQHETGEVIRNLEYFMLRAFGQDVTPGSTVIRSTNHTPDGWSGGLGSVAFLGANGDVTAHVYNPTGEAIEAAVTVNGQGGAWQKVTVPAWGLVTVHKSNGEINVSEVPEDDEFELNPAPKHLIGDVAPGKVRVWGHDE